MADRTTRSLRVALVGGFLVILLVIGGIGSSAMAQEETAGEEARIEQTEYTESVTVTGTLIPRPTLDALSPVTVMGVEEITYSGVSRMEDLMAQLPQAFAGQNSTWANGATGTATVDLRQLGTNRTLVLINGRRMAPGDASGIYAPDLNVIPAALVERVDVLTGGASTVYGSDAVAGVVNFVLDTEFEGFRGGVQYSFFNHNNDNATAQRINEEAGFDYPEGYISDGDGWNVNVAWGGKFGDGRGHASAYIGYRDLEAVTKSQRDYLNCSVGGSDDGPVCSGSSTTPRGRFITTDTAGNETGDYALDWIEDGGDGQSFRDRIPATDVFNYGPYNHIQRPDERWTAGAFLNYEFNEHVEGFTEVMLMNDYTNAQIAPSGNFSVANQVNCDNPMLSDDQRQKICGDGGWGPTDIADVFILRRNVEGGERNEDINHTNYRLVSGIRGDINDQWTYSLYGLHAQTITQFSYNNDLNIDRMQNALIVDGDPADPSTWVCRSGDEGCAPWNIFTEGAVEQAALDYMSTIAVQYGKTKTELVNLTLTGDLEDYGATIPSATEGIQVALGSEYRSERFKARPDEVYWYGLAAGFGGGQPPVDGGFSVKELFLEALVPIAQDITGAQDLSLELGYRYSDYDTSGAADTYKAMFAWAPMPDFKFRGGYNRAVRAANAYELFLPTNFGLGGSEDICAGPAPSASLDDCINTGVTPAQYGNILPNPADQYNTLSGGNVDLAAETADTYTFGIVITPRAISGFSLAFDYYDIEIDDAIDTLDADDIIQTCATTGDPELCGLINRDSLGTLWLTQDGYTETNYQNIGKLGAKGVDVNFAYTFPVGKGGIFSADLTGTYLMESTLTNPLVSYDCAGFYGFQCGQPNSEWRHRARLTWNSNFDLAVSLAWRMIGSAMIDDASSDPDIGNPGNEEFAKTNNIWETDAFHYFDLSATWGFTKGVQWTLGVNNILDKEPPLWPELADEFDVNTYATYDPLGRYVFTAMRFDF